MINKPRAARQYYKVLISPNDSNTIPEAAVILAAELYDHITCKTFGFYVFICQTTAKNSRHCT